MLPASSYLYFFLSCALSLFSSRTLIDQWKRHEHRHLLEQPKPLIQQIRFGNHPLPLTSPRYRWQDLLPPPTPVGEKPGPQTLNYDVNWIPLGLVVTTATLRHIRAYPAAQSVKNHHEPPTEPNTELSFLAFYALINQYE